MILFSLYALLLVSLGIRDAVREKNSSAADSFFVNSRSSGPWLVGISIIASCVGGSATLGMAGLAWQAGTPAFWWLGSGAIGLSLLCLFLARKVRESKARTMPEIIDIWLGNSSVRGISPRRLVSFIIVPAWLAILAAQFTAMASMVGAMTGLGEGTALALGSALVAAYSISGGQATVMRSDIPQFLIMAAGLIFTLLYLAGENPQACSQIRFQLVNDDFSLSRMNYFLVILGGSYVVCPMLFGRLLSARNEQAAVAGCRLAIAGLLIMAVLITTMGLMAKGYVPADCPRDEVMASILNKMPYWGAIPLLLALLSAILSSADSCLITASTVCCNDLLGDKGQHSALICRLAALALSFFAWLLATAGHGILDLLLMANDIYVSGVVAPVFFAMLLPHRLCPPAQISLLAIFSGGICGLAGAITASHTLVYTGMLLSGGIILVRAFFTAGSKHFSARGM